MADNSKIAWTDATWSPITGCSPVSPACTNCYAMRLAGTRLQHHPSRAGLTRETKAGPVWTGEVRFNEQWLAQPLQWKRLRRIFVCAHSDLFHERVPEEWIDRVFAVMARCSRHTFQILTKRPERMRNYLTALYALGERDDGEWFSRGMTTPLSGPRIPLQNVWLGVTAEDQRRADERIPLLLDTPAAKRFVSVEPMLGAVDLTNLDPNGNFRPVGAHGWSAIWKNNSLGRQWLDWVICGGESGPNARPLHPDWVRGLRDQCIAANVPFFFKQWGEFTVAVDRDRDDPDWRLDYSNKLADKPSTRWLNLAGGCGFHGEHFHVMRRVGKRAAGRLLDGREWLEMPR